MYVCSRGPPNFGAGCHALQGVAADGIRNLPPLAQTWTTEFLTSAALGVRAACSVLCPLYPGRRTSRSHAWRVLPGGFRGDTQSRTMRPRKAGRGTVYLHTICGPARPPPWRARRRGPGYFRSHTSGNFPISLGTYTPHALRCFLLLSLNSKNVNRNPSGSTCSTSACHLCSSATRSCIHAAAGR